ncbi:hypothetical protein V8E52_000249 [Russula decolorans]
MSEDQLAEMLSKVKSSRETEALRARLPAQLAPFASNISVVEPIQTVCTNPTDGVYCCSCEVNERRICMSVAVVPSPHSQSQDLEEPHAKPLELVWRDWWTGASQIPTCILFPFDTVLLIVECARRRQPLRAVSRSSHDGVKSVVEEVVRDMGFRECELDNKLEVIEALLGDDGRQLSEGEAHEGTTLRETIEDELEMREDNIHCHFQMLQSRLHDELVWNNIFIRGSEARSLGVGVEEEGEQGEEIERESRAVRVWWALRRRRLRPAKFTMRMIPTFYIREPRLDLESHLFYFDIPSEVRHV